MQSPKLIDGCRALNDLLLRTPGDQLQNTIHRVATGYVALHRKDLSPTDAIDLATQAASIVWAGVLEHRLKTRKDIVMTIYSIVSPTIGVAWGAQ